MYSPIIETNLLGRVSLQPRTLISVQSVSLGPLTSRYLPGLTHFEDRNIYLAELLRNPRSRAILVLSNDPDEYFLDYCLNKVSKALRREPGELRQRVDVLRIPSSVDTCLTRALLDDSQSLLKLERMIGNSPFPLLDFWVVTDLEVELAGILNLPYVGPKPDSIGLDAKSFARKVFHRLGMKRPAGREDVYSLRAVQDVLQDLAAETQAKEFLIKLNREEAGNGIARVRRESICMDSAGFRAHLSTAKAIPITEYEAELSAQGAVVEEMIRAVETAWPSVKMQIAEDGTVTNLATHDQCLMKMAYEGSIFPANQAYRHELISMGFKVANELSTLGVRGIASIDFLACRNDPYDRWTLWALEINTRKGATTHPYFWTRIVSDAHYDPVLGELMRDGRPVVYVSSEYLHSQGLSMASPRDVISAIRAAGIDYTVGGDRGVLVHMATCIRQFSKLGATIIAPTLPDAMTLREQLVEVVAEVAGRG